MKTLQSMRGGSSSAAIANVFALGIIFIICSGEAKGNFYDGADGSQIPATDQQIFNYGNFDTKGI
jgi:hypothetical protein